MRRLLPLFGFLLLLLLVLGLGCSGKSKPSDTGTGPQAWINLTLPQREFAAEIFRVGIAIGAWQELQSQCLSETNTLPTDSIQANWEQMLNCRRIAADRARLALRMANSEHLKWLKPFLSQYLESANPPIGDVAAWKAWNNQLAQIKLEYQPPFAYLNFEPGTRVGYKMALTEPEVILWQHNTDGNIGVAAGKLAVATPEPAEERSPMARLLSSSWKVPPDSGFKQVQRWWKMTITEFDDPNYQLGAVIRSSKTR